MSTQALKDVVAPIRAAQYDYAPEAALGALKNAFAADATIHMCYPFGDMTGPDAFFQSVIKPLFDAMPNTERRDTIVIAGEDETGRKWVGCCGFFCGTFEGPWLDIPPTGHLTHMRFHEFYAIENGKIVEFQAIWDIPEVMKQANAWPLAPSLGREWCIPAPATMDGLGPHDPANSLPARQLIIDMLQAMKRHPQQGPEAMEMQRYWHEKMNWYGPAGIGTGRGIEGFRHWHQIPFLNAMPDRGQHLKHTNHIFFAEGNYAAVTGWPNMAQTLTGDGWMGIAPSGKFITMKSLDFWRIENGKIRENWVLVDLLDMYAQIGVDVFARLREFNKARSLARVPMPSSMDLS